VWGTFLGSLVPLLGISLKIFSVNATAANCHNSSSMKYGVIVVVSDGGTANVRRLRVIYETAKRRSAQ